MTSTSQRAHEYLASLPAGARSYPACQMKASILRSLFDSAHLEAIARGLPAELAELALHPPPASSWVAEVAVNTFALAAIDSVFHTENAMLAHVEERNRALLDSIAYRILFRLVGGERLVAQVAPRWEHFHRGTQLVLQERVRGERRFRLLLTAPTGLIPVVIGRIHAVAIQTALQVAGEKNVSCRATLLDAERTEIEAAWD